MDAHPNGVENLALFNKKLGILHQITLELAQALSFDEMCRQAVVAWYSRLNPDRIGMWFVSSDAPTYLCGSFGIDENGQVRDERTQAIGIDAPIFEQVLHNKHRIYYNPHQALYDDRSQPVGWGETAAAALWDGHTVIGFIVIDNLLSQQPISGQQRNLLYLYGQMIGHLTWQKRSERIIAQLLDETQQRLQETETLRQAGIAVASALKYDEAIERILEELNRVVPYDSATVQLKVQDHLEVIGAHGYTQEAKIIGLSFPILDHAPTGIVMQGKIPSILAEVPAEHHDILDIHHQGIGSWMGIPIMLQERTTGMLALCSCRPANFTVNHARLATAFAAHVAITLENARLFGEVQRLVTHDPLTEVYNRRHFMELAQRTFQRANRAHQDQAIIMLDIDHFKNINDTYGHLVGDQVLHAVAQTCLKQLRPSDLMGRYGGEEFIILLHTLQPEHIWQQVSGPDIAERLRQAVEDLHMPTDQAIIRLTISLGLAFNNWENSDLMRLIEQADLALLQSKIHGRNRVTVAR